MEARRRTWFDEHGLVVGAAEGDARPLPFYAGAMHYWRVDPLHWDRCLAQLHKLGLTLVETYVPWRVHEPERGVYQWRGRCDLARFIERARAAGLGVVVRPGPHINAELTSFGFPDHVLGDAACQARTSRGTPVWMPSPPRAWPVPSYASAAFRERVRGWYAAVADVVRPLLAPDGPVVAIGVDNEAQMFFRLGAYDADYHPDAVAAFHAATGCDAPTAWHREDAARCAAWVRWKDRYLADALGAFAQMLDEVGLGGVGRFHNLPPGHHGLYDVRGLQQAIAGPVGIDAYTARADFRELRRRALAIAGNARPVAIGFEVGVGFFPWFPPLDPVGTAKDDSQRERDHLLTLLAAGLRGFNLFMAVERERYYGAAISATGTVETHASWIAPLLRALAEVDWTHLARPAPIALVDVRADARFGLASAALDPMTPVVTELLGLGPGGAAELGDDPGAVLARRWQGAIASALELAQVGYVLVEESITEDELAKFAAVIVPTLERIDRGLWQRVRAVAEAKRTILVIGPGTPVRDELDQPLGDPPPKRVGRLTAASLDDLPGLAADLVDLAPHADAWTIERPKARAEGEPEAVRVFAHVDGRGAARVVFVCNDADKAVQATLLAGDGAARLRDPFTSERLRVAGGKVTVTVAARGVRMLLVEG